MISKKLSLCLLAAIANGACSLPDNEENTGGVNFPDNEKSTGGSSAQDKPPSSQGGAGGSNEPDQEKPAPGSSVRGYLVVSSDYESANVSLLGVDGSVLSESFISSASASTGLSSALSGDLVAPSTVVEGDELVLLDRYPAAVLTWINLSTAKVRTQLSVATGFSSNPHDYIPVSPTKAYVTRFGGNANSGQESFDEGDDVLIIDPSVPEITGRIALGASLDGEDPDILPRADRALMAGGLLRVLGVAISADYKKRTASRLISIDPATDEIVNVAVIENMTSCSQLSLSPSGDEIALACNGAYGQEPALGFPDSGIVLFDTSDEPEEVDRFLAVDLGAEQLAGVDYISDTQIAYTTTGRYNADRTAMAAADTARTLNTISGKASEPLVATKSKPFQLGDFRCVPRAKSCLLTDAETDGGIVHYFSVTSEGSLKAEREIKVETKLGLPPRYLGEF